MNAQRHNISTLPESNHSFLAYPTPSLVAMWISVTFKSSIQFSVIVVDFTKRMKENTDRCKSKLSLFFSFPPLPLLFCIIFLSPELSLSFSPFSPLKTHPLRTFLLWFFTLPLLLFLSHRHSLKRFFFIFFFSLSFISNLQFFNLNFVVLNLLLFSFFLFLSQI